MQSKASACKRKEAITQDFGRLLGVHAVELRRYLDQLMLRQEVAVATPDDILQEVWITAFRCIDAARVMPKNELANWLKSLARRKLVDALRTATRVRRGGGRRGTKLAGDSFDSSLPHLFEQLTSSTKTPSRAMAAKEVVAAVQAVV